MLNVIYGECAAIAHTPKDEPVTHLEQSVVKFINDLVGDLPKLLQGNDEISVQVKSLLIHNFITVSRSVAQWDMSAEQMNAELGLDVWQQKVLPSHPTRRPEDTDVSYITRQLEWIKKGIDKEHLEERLHMSMSACLFILAQDMKRLLHTDFKMLFPGIQRLSLNIDKGTLDVKEMSPELEELGKMLSLAFKVLWKAKEKVAEWDRSMAKVNSKSAIEALEFALSEVSNDQQVDLKELKQRLKDLRIEKPDPVDNLRLHELVRGLIYARIVDQRKLREKLGMAYEEVMEKIRNSFNVDLEQTPMRTWRALSTLT
ncbi:hypothetical protein H0H93_010610 [Arthromyces matolae]|nr:hypothetical protein H0H93_010610 [Arthromyces matolae]